MSDDSLAALIVAAFDRADEAVFISRVHDGSLATVNATAAQWLGYSRRELREIGLHRLEDGDPEQARRQWEALIAHMRRHPEGRMLSGTRLRRKDGSLIDVEMVNALFDYEGTEYTVCTARDVTERLRVERELQLTQLAVDRAGEAMFRVSAKGFVLAANEMAVNRLGYSHDELLQMHIGDFDPDYDRSMWPGHFEQLQREGQMVLETTHVRKDGSRFPVEVSVTYIEFGGQKLCCSFIRDLTENKRIHQQLMLAERTSALGTLAAGVAHELNNPLTYVRSNLEYLGTRLDSVTGISATDRYEFGEALADVLDGVDRVHRIVTDLRTFSRSSDEPIQAVDLPAVIEVAQRVTANQVQHMATLECTALRLPPASGQESRLVQVLTNLIVNASQAFASPAPDRNRIRISGLVEGSWVVLRISDNGRGIDAEDLPKIFDPFFTTKGMGGTGLGLSLCYGIVRSFGGELDVESRVGEGTTFSLRLPMASPTSTGPEIDDERSAARRARVVLIDDDELVLRGMRRLLREHHNVEAFGEGEKALAYLRENQDVDIILCDLMMPRMTGADVYLALQAEFPELCSRIWFISGGTFSAQLSEFATIMSERILAKPVSRATLLDKIQSVLDGDAG